ncbi:MAG: 16S rRNA (adenine(1518)-N(6)/adenine(1519)-N(6))-dimethyltransferase RsmA [Calditrichia bacterium]
MIKNRTTENKLVPRRHLSQNFLQDANIARKIAGALQIPEPGIILEIGPGPGMLTQFLIPLARKVIAVEVDRQLAGDLSPKLGNPANLQIVEQDFLKLDLASLLSQYPDSGKWIIGNIPYHITSPIVFKILDYADELEQTVMMVQKEVGQRIAASPGGKEYGILSVFCQFYAKTEYLFTVPSRLFFPQPKVDSGVIRLTFKESPQSRVKDPTLFKKIVKTTFGKRRKMLRNTLSIVVSQAILANVDMDLSRRPETLSVEEFIYLSNRINDLSENE